MMVVCWLSFRKPPRAQGGRDSATLGRALGGKMHSVFIVQASKPFIREPCGQTPPILSLWAAWAMGRGLFSLFQQGQP